jgi:hypothetical protein
MVKRICNATAISADSFPFIKNIPAQPLLGVTLCHKLGSND